MKNSIRSIIRKCWKSKKKIKCISLISTSCYISGKHILVKKLTNIFKSFRVSKIGSESKKFQKYRLKSINRRYFFVDGIKRTMFVWLGRWSEISATHAQ